MVYDIASPYFGVRKCWGGDTFALPGGVFFLVDCFFLMFFFCVMTPRSCESWTNPLDRREERNATVFLCGIDIVSKSDVTCVVLGH